MEEGAYVVLDEEEEDDEALVQPNIGAQDRTVNGSAAQPGSLDDDRYVATALSAEEEGYEG